MSDAAGAPRMKITYATLRADNEALHVAFEAALATETLPTDAPVAMTVVARIAAIARDRRPVPFVVWLIWCACRPFAVAGADAREIGRAHV